MKPNKAVASKTLYIKNNSNTYVSPSKLDSFDPQIHNKKFGGKGKMAT